MGKLGYESAARVAHTISVGEDTALMCVMAAFMNDHIQALASRSALWDAKQKAAWKPIWQVPFYTKWESEHDFYAKNTETRHSADRLVRSSSLIMI